MIETWYVMEDGSVGDPREIAQGEDGRLCHSDGRRVAYAPHGPRSRSVDVPEAKAVTADDLVKEAVVPIDRQMKPRGRRGYKTR